MSEEIKLRITSSVEDIPHSRRPAKLSTDTKEFFDQQMHKNGKMKSY